MYAAMLNNRATVNVPVLPPRERRRPVETGARLQLQAVREGRRRAREIDTVLRQSLTGLEADQERLGRAAQRLASVRASLESAADALRAGECTSPPAAPDPDPPPELVDPISHGPMDSPVRARDGHAYDRESIEQWFRCCRRSGRPETSPLTNLPLASDDLQPCPKLRAARHAWLTRLAKESKPVAAKQPPFRLRRRGLREALRLLRGSRTEVASARELCR
eukprot:TRINITY_DN14580_c0_g1_i1.p1 TRINITY_DN14580_c0_g1~~TRINITY_DN14580_c0_g1_i1.p1  ORF type:complete len:221 (+),score=36.33 TRINITY_DN14580_c0_g1_i1:65-727(+)